MTETPACPYCPDGHRDPWTRPWHVRVASQVDSDGQPTHLMVMPTNGAHVAQSDADWVWQLIRDYWPGPARAQYRNRSLNRSGPPADGDVERDQTGDPLMTDHTTPDAPWFEFDFESCRDAHPLDAGQTCELQQGHERHRRGRDTWSVDVDTVDRIDATRAALDEFGPLVTGRKAQVLIDRLQRALNGEWDHRYYGSNAEEADRG